ncbi:MAG: type II toxin-antitoxin system MqsR family toxin [Phycisphaerae bacterium]|nr:type II toxin-antitoxin system MqsR family toxin [Phycisphaerae bacterium]
MVSRDEVVAFLNLFKGCLELDLYGIKDREKNLQGLIDLGITPKERKEILLGLTPENYHSGPKPDDTDDTKEVWEFGTSVGNTEVYIKLRVVRIASKNTYRALVWSFHPAEFPITYPLR